MVPYRNDYQVSKSATKQRPTIRDQRPGIFIPRSATRPPPRPPRYNYCMVIRISDIGQSNISHKVSSADYTELLAKVWREKNISAYLVQALWASWVRRGFRAAITLDELGGV